MGTPVRTLLFTLKPNTDKAHHELKRMNMNSCHAAKHGSDVCEYVGVVGDRERLQSAGFSLMQEQESCKFEQDGYHSPENLQKEFEQLQTMHPSLAKVINLTDLHKLFMMHANTIAGEMKYPAGQSCCMGGDIHFAYQQHGSLAFLVEAGGDSFQPSTASREEVLVEMWPGIKQFLAIPTSVSGHIHVDDSKTPAAGAVLKVQGLDFEQDEASTYF